MARKVLITAGACGIGKSIAAAFMAAGDDVYVCDIDADALAVASSELPGLKAGICDIADRSQIKTMVAEAIDQLGGLDVLVNNAGIAGPTALVRDVDPDQWQHVLQVNLTGTFNVTQAAIPALINSGRGVITIMSSAAGRFGYPTRSPYATTKWGLIGLMKTLAMELGEYHIRANAILPGSVDGARFQRVLEQRAQAAGKSVAEMGDIAMANQSLKYLVEPHAIAALALFLASDAGKSISGQVFPIDGDLQRN